ncbi:uncharacterized protein [Amphiura filiformis]|uniref:uncharacterized protein n=1 Tax=Amphiura filiformis TaxID=82378 RepID=UPI003B21BCEF
MPSARSAAKLNSQPDETWALLQKRLIELPMDLTEFVSAEVAEFIELKSTASYTCPGYTLVSLVAVAAFLISLGAEIQTTPGMTTKPVLYSLICGPPTTGKSQALKIAALHPLQMIEDAAKMKLLPSFWKRYLQVACQHTFRNRKMLHT